jgi:hypothetical protein
MVVITIKEVKEVQTYPTGVSPVGTDVTHDSAYIVSIVKTPRLLLGALYVSHMKMLTPTYWSNEVNYTYRT